ncbi:hypothetical protein N9M41_07885 [Rhodopirellula sp.]|nr:hypothetical protein [Rhodopirellula sp.]
MDNGNDFEEFNGSIYPNAGSTKSLDGSRNGDSKRRAKLILRSYFAGMLSDDLPFGFFPRMLGKELILGKWGDGDPIPLQD